MYDTVNVQHIRYLTLFDESAIARRTRPKMQLMMVVMMSVTFVGEPTHFHDASMLS